MNSYELDWTPCSTEKAASFQSSTEYSQKLTKYLLQRKPHKIPK